MRAPPESFSRSRHADLERASITLQIFWRARRRAIR
jgi:hypothetical protein